MFLGILGAYFFCLYICPNDCMQTLNVSFTFDLYKAQYPYIVCRFEESSTLRRNLRWPHCTCKLTLTAYWPGSSGDHRSVSQNHLVLFVCVVVLFCVKRLGITWPKWYNMYGANVCATPPLHAVSGNSICSIVHFKNCTCLKAFPSGSQLSNLYRMWYHFVHVLPSRLIGVNPLMHQMTCLTSLYSDQFPTGSGLFISINGSCEVKHPECTSISQRCFTYFQATRNEVGYC